MASNESEAGGARRPRLEVVSDVVCPWCYIGKHRLDQALALLDRAIALEVRWRPFELNPDMPRNGMARTDYCQRKFGSVERAAQIYARIATHAEADGLPLAIERVARTPNTRAAHQLIDMAGAAGCQDAVVDALFHAYFVAGQDIGDYAVLADIATAAGLARDALRARLADDADRDAVLAAKQEAHALGVDGVPAFLYNGRLLFAGAQSPETIARAIERAYARGL